MTTIEEIGDLVDKIDSLVAGLDIPIAPEVHIGQLKRLLPEIADAIKQYYIDTTGENHWE